MKDNANKIVSELGIPDQSVVNFCDLSKTSVDLDGMKSWVGKEKAIGKKVCDFDREDIIKVITKWRFVTISQRLLVLKSYYNYCILQNIRDDNPVNEIDIVSLKDKINTYFLTEKEMFKILDEISFSPNKLYYTAIILSLYEGISSADLANIRYRDINHTKKTIKLGNKKTLKLSDRLLKTYKDMENLSVFVYKHKTGKLETDNDFIIKTFKPINLTGKQPDQKGRIIRVFNLYMKPELDLNTLTIGDVYSSGMYLQIYKAAKERGLDIISDLKSPKTSVAKVAQYKEMFEELPYTYTWNLFKLKQKEKFLAVYDKLQES